MRRLLVFALSLAASTAPLFAEGPDSFHFELTGAAWLNAPSGFIQAKGTPIDFVHDLAAGATEARFYGRLVVKPALKHRFIVEGSPLSFTGSNSISRSIVFLNRTYNINTTVNTDLSLNYFYAGYQYDPFVGSYGHLGFQVGAAYLGAQGTLTSVSAGLTETKSIAAPIPMPGTEFRLFPIPHVHFVQVEGFVRGLPAGSYGYFVEGGAQAGVRYRHFAVMAGYREMFANLHNSNGLDALGLHLKGPIVSVSYQY
jgi:hypothetical protein